MILYITPQNKPFYKNKLKEIYALRHKIFKEKLKWNVRSINGLEQDEYDHEDAYYIVYLNQDKEIKGCMRLIATHKKHMLRYSFSKITSISCSAPDIWEVSRFAVDSSEENSPMFRGINQITYQLYAALYEFGLANNIEKYVFLASLSVEKLLKRIGCLPHRLSPVTTIGGIKSLVGSIQVDVETFVHLIYEGNLSPFFSLNKAKIENNNFIRCGISP